MIVLKVNIFCQEIYLIKKIERGAYIYNFVVSLCTFFRFVCSLPQLKQLLAGLPRHGDRSCQSR